MKTAEEWAQVNLDNPDFEIINFLKQIQLDAWKQGMTEASEILFQCAFKERKSPRQCEYEILKLRDSKITI